MRIEVRSLFRLATAGVAIAAVTALGCQSTPKKDDTQTSGTGSEFREVAEPVTEPVTEVAIDPSLQTVYFDFDKYAIRNDARPLLRGNADTIRKRAAAWRRITIEGNTDERGTEEYNLALGERRASSVRQYLVDLGVPASKLETVSFGESKPAVMGHDESAWRWNRRTDFATPR